LNSTILSVHGDTATIQTNLGTLTTSVGNLQGTTNNEANYSLAALGVSAIDLILLIALLALFARKKT
jgi:hypothetical protein